MDKQQKTLTAIIDKMSGINTARVRLTGSVVHPKYNKRYSTTRHLSVDTTTNPVHIGDTVAIAETTKISKRKSWTVVHVLAHASETVSLQVSKKARVGKKIG